MLPFALPLISIYIVTDNIMGFHDWKNSINKKEWAKFLLAIIVMYI